MCCVIAAAIDMQLRIAYEPALIGSSEIQRLERIDLIELCHGIIFDFYTELPHVSSPPLPSPPLPSPPLSRLEEYEDELREAEVTSQQMLTESQEKLKTTVVSLKRE